MLVLGVLLAEVGAAPFVRALGLVTPEVLAAAVAITLATTVLTAWRWTWVARRLGLRLGLRRAVAAYYRSQLLNQVLPGGVAVDSNGNIYVVEIANHRHPARIRRPDREMHAVRTFMPDRMRPHLVEQP